MNRFFFSSLILLSSANARAENPPNPPPPVAVLRKVHGDAYVIDASAKVSADTQGKRGHKLEAGSPLALGETLVTRDGWVQLILVEGNNEVVLASETSIRFDASELQPGKVKGTRTTLAKGMARFILMAKYAGPGENRFEVRTPGASIISRGGSFYAQFAPATFESVGAAEEGNLFIKNIKQTKIIGMKAGTFSKVVESAAPTAPTPLTQNPVLETAVKSFRSLAH